jgi:hypothetical protein
MPHKSGLSLRLDNNFLILDMTKTYFDKTTFVFLVECNKQKNKP